MSALQPTPPNIPRSSFADLFNKDSGTRVLETLKNRNLVRQLVSAMDKASPKLIKVSIAVARAGNWGRGGGATGLGEGGTGKGVAIANIYCWGCFFTVIDTKAQAWNIDCWKAWECPVQTMLLQHSSWRWVTHVWHPQPFLLFLPANRLT